MQKKKVWNIFTSALSKGQLIPINYNFLAKNGLMEKSGHKILLN